MIRRPVVLAVCCFIGAVAQACVAQRIAIGMARPDIVLVVIACGGVLIGPAWGAWTGLLCGFMIAVMAGFNYGSFLASRTITGAYAGWLRSLVLKDSLFVAPLCAATSTLCGEGIYFLMAPTHHVMRWAVHVALELVYNAVLAVPVYMVMRGVGIGYAANAVYEGQPV